MSKEWTIVEGRQWSVTNFGLLRTDEDYDIQAYQLGDLCNDGVTPLWVAQVAGKGSTDLDDFLDAYTRALRIHAGKYQPLPHYWREAAIARIGKAKLGRARHAAILQKIAESRDPHDEDGGTSYTMDAYHAAATALFGPDLRWAW